MPGALRDELIIPSCPGPTILHKPHSLPPTPLNMLQNPSHSLYKNIRTSTQWSQIIDRNKVCVQRTKNGVSEAFLCSGRGGEGGGKGAYSQWKLTLTLSATFEMASFLSQIPDRIPSWFKIWFPVDPSNRPIRNIAKGHNGPEGWVHLAKTTSWSHITSSNINLDQISSSESRPSINFKISTNISILTKL